MKNVMYYRIKNDKLSIMPGYVSDVMSDVIEVFERDNKIKIYDIDHYVPLNISLENENLRYIDLPNILIKFEGMIPYDLASNDSYIDLIIDEMLINNEYHNFILENFEKAIEENSDKTILRSVYVLIKGITNYCKRKNIV